MPNFENTTICGHLGKDAVMRETSAGHVTEFTVAVNHGKGDKKSATWYTIACWHGTAKGCADLRKGDPVICIGNMRCNKWEDRDGITRWSWTMQAHTVGKALYIKQEQKREPEPPDESHTDPGANEEFDPPF